MTQVSTGPPTITTHPTNQLTTISMSVTLNCEGTGGGSITYRWQTRNISGGQWNDISNNQRVVVRDLQESRQYRCVVSNEAGRTRSNVAIITVLSKFNFYYDTLVNRSRHMVVCHVAQEAYMPKKLACHTKSILTGRNKI